MIFQKRSSEGVVLPVEVFAPKTYTDQTGMSFSCFFLFKIFNLEGLECVFVFETIVSFTSGFKSFKSSYGTS